MSQHDAYLDRMTTRLGDLEGEIARLSQEHAPDERGDGPPEVRELRASLAAAKERLHALRRAGAELDDEMTLSFGQAFERLQAAVSRARTSLAGRTRAA
jgi:hypothetical protein